MKQTTLKGMIETRSKILFDNDAAKKNYKKIVKRCHRFFEGLEPEIKVENNEYGKTTKFKYQGALAIGIEAYYNGAEGLFEWDIDHRICKKLDTSADVEPTIENCEFPFAGERTDGYASLDYQCETKLDPVKEGWQDFLSDVKKHLLKTSSLRY